MIKRANTYYAFEKDILFLDNVFNKSFVRSKRNWFSYLFDEFSSDYAQLPKFFN